MFIFEFENERWVALRKTRLRSKSDIYFFHHTGQTLVHFTLTVVSLFHDFWAAMSCQFSCKNYIYLLVIFSQI